MNRFVSFAGLIAALLFTGCASTVQHVPMPNLSQTIDDPARGRIYVMRPASFGAAISMHVMDGGEAIGDTGPKGFLCWERSPGDVILTSSSENSSRISLPVRAGQVYYVHQHVRMGWWIARTELEAVEEAQGKLLLKQCKPAKVEQPEGPLADGKRK